MAYSTLLQKYVYKTYYDLLKDSSFQDMLQKAGWVYPGFIPKTYFIQHNRLIRKYLTIGERYLITDIQFQRLLCQAGFYGPACTTSTTTTSTTT